MITTLQFVETCMLASRHIRPWGTYYWVLTGVEDPVWHSIDDTHWCFLGDGILLFDINGNPIPIEIVSIYELKIV